MIFAHAYKIKSCNLYRMLIYSLHIYDSGQSKNCVCRCSDIDLEFICFSYSFWKNLSFIWETVSVDLLSFPWCKQFSQLFSSNDVFVAKTFKMLGGCSLHLWAGRRLETRRKGKGIIFVYVWLETGNSKEGEEDHCRKAVPKASKVSTELVLKMLCDIRERVALADKSLSSP